MVGGAELRAAPARLRRRPESPVLHAEMSLWTVETGVSRREIGGVRHLVDHAEWLRLLSEQFRRTLDDGVVRIGKQGARGVLFHVTLLTHGYTFVAKDTVPEFVEDLEHETAVYHRLQLVQGVYVPVFLGAVDLRDLGRVYYYDLRVRVVYMMFLSWAGRSRGLGSYG